jgi:type II secretion system protein G
MIKKVNNIGFTLIELIVVITIISVMAAGVLAVLNPFEQFKKSADAKTKSDLGQVQKALEIYYEDKQSYPANSAGYNIVDAKLGTIAWGSSWGTYMSIIPRDSTAGHKYIYFSPDGQTYYLYANLIRGSKDPQVCNSGNKCTNVPSGVNCGNASIICNFGVSSPNKSP